MKNIWVPIAVICVVVAIVLFIQMNFEAAFVVAAVGAVAWFLNYRGQVKHRLGDDLEDFDEGAQSDVDNSAHDSLS
jgi:hypothetical protein